MQEQVQNVIRQAANSADKAAKEAIKEVKEEIKQEVKEEVKQELQQETPVVEAPAPAPAPEEPAPAPEESAPLPEPNPVSEIIQQAGASILQSMWEFTKWIFGTSLNGISKIIPNAAKQSTASILKTDFEIISSGIKFVFNFLKGYN